MTWICWQFWKDLPWHPFTTSFKTSRQTSLTLEFLQSKETKVLLRSLKQKENECLQSGREGDGKQRDKLIGFWKWIFSHTSGSEAGNWLNKRVVTSSPSFHSLPDLLPAFVCCEPIDVKQPIIVPVICILFASLMKPQKHILTTELSS